MGVLFCFGKVFRAARGLARMGTKLTLGPTGNKRLMNQKVCLERNRSRNPVGVAMLAKKRLRFRPPGLETFDQQLDVVEIALVQ